MSERTQTGLVALIITGCLALAIVGLVAMVGGRSGQFTPKAITPATTGTGVPVEPKRPASPGVRPVVIRSDYDACQVGDVVTLVGDATINLENRLLVFVRFQGDGLPSCVKCLDDPPPAVTEGQRVRLTGTVRAKPVNSFLILLLEKCSVGQP